jgi:hypothetical protein
MEHPVIVVSYERGAWRAGVENGAWRETAGQAFGERYPALEWAHRWAQAHRPSLVRVLREDGLIEDEWSYGAFKGIRRLGPRPSSQPVARAG